MKNIENQIKTKHIQFYLVQDLLMDEQHLDKKLMDF